MPARAGQRTRNEAPGDTLKRCGSAPAMAYVPVTVFTGADSTMSKDARAMPLCGLVGRPGGT